MPKRLYQIKDFSGGLNNLKDPADIADNEVADVSNLTFTKQGAIGGAFNMKTSSNYLGDAYQTAAGDHIDHLEAGYGLGYFETDHAVADSITRSLDITGNSGSGGQGFTFVYVTSTQRIHLLAHSDGSVKQDPDSGSNASAGTAINLANWFPIGTEILISGSETGGGGGVTTSITAGSMDGIYTVVGASGSSVINLNRPPNNMISTALGGLGEDNGGQVFYATATITGIPSGDQVLLLAHPDEHKIDVYSTKKGGWTTDVITLQNYTDDDNNSKVLYHRSEDSIRCFDTNLDTNGRVKWYGWISRQHFAYPGNQYTYEYSGYYAKDNDLKPPSFGQYEKDSGTSLTYPTAGLGFNLKCFSSSNEGLIEEKTYEFAQSFVYDGNQESLLSHYNKLDNSPVSTLDTTLSATAFKSLSVQIGAKGAYDPRISGGRIYIRESGTDDEFNLLLDIDLTKGARTDLSGDFTPWKYASNNSEFFIGANVTTYLDVDSLSFLTYETINGYPSNIFSNHIGGIGETYKDSVVSNNRVFVCNTRVKDENKGQHNISGLAGEADVTHFPDRIMYSMPNRLDTFPSFNFIEAAKGDADSYTAIQSFADRLLAYKRRSLDIINISSPSDANWFLEDSKNYMGVEFHGAVVKTQYGVVWVNKQGLYFYDGSQIKDLSENKIDDNTWYTFVSTNSMIIYDEATSLIYVVKNCGGDGDTYMYDLKKGNFTFLKDFAHDNITNVVDTSFSDTPNVLVGTIESTRTRFYQVHRSFQNVANVSFKTKDFDFGDAARIKKIYAVYVTYKSTGVLTNLFKLVSLDDATAHTLSGTLATTSSYKTVKLTPSSTVSCTKAHILLDTSISSASVEINDISIEYRQIYKRDT